MQNFIDFINNNSSNIYLFLEILAAITGLILYKKYKNTPAKYFIHFLVYTVVIVIIGRYSHLVRGEGILNFLEGTLLEKNYWWFTIFWNIAAGVFFGWYYSKILYKKLHKKLLRVSVVIFILISIVAILLNIDLFFTGSINIVEISGAIIILQCAIYYFIEILQSDRVLMFYKSLNFYISCAILVLWLIQTPLTFFESYFRLADIEYVNLRGYINLVVISFMYISYTVGLIVSKPEYD